MVELQAQARSWLRQKAFPEKPIAPPAALLRDG